MTLNKIQTRQELLLYIPELLRVFTQLGGKWEPDLTPVQFGEKLIALFDESDYYAEIENGRLNYFIAILGDEKPKAKFWLLYINTAIRERSRSIVQEIVSSLRSDGFTSIQFNTVRFTQSYKRWAESFGAKQKFITYELKF